MNGLICSVIWSQRLATWVAFFALGLMINFVHAQPVTDPASSPTSQLQEVGKKFQEVHNQIHEIQKKATETKAVQKAQKEFVEAMNAAMLKADPEVEEDLKKSNELLEKIRSHPQIDDPVARERDLELKKMLLDYRFLERKLSPAREKAAEEPKPKEKFEKLQEVILVEMKKLNPDTQKLMDRKDALEDKYRELRRIVRAGIVGDSR